MTYHPYPGDPPVDDPKPMHVVELTKPEPCAADAWQEGYAAAVYDDQRDWVTQARNPYLKPRRTA